MAHFYRNYDIHTDHLILARKPDLIIIDKKKRICKIVDFDVSADHKIKLKESEKKKKKRTSILQGNKKNMEYEGDDYTNRDCCIRYSN